MLPKYDIDKIVENLEDCKEFLNQLPSKLKRKGCDIRNTLLTYMVPAMRSIYDLYDHIIFKDPKVTKDYLFSSILPREFNISPFGSESASVLKEVTNLKREIANLKG
jgi:hypothetical protein